MTHDRQKKRPEAAAKKRSRCHYASKAKSQKKTSQQSQQQQQQPQQQVSPTESLASSSPSLSFGDAERCESTATDKVNSNNKVERSRAGIGASIKALVTQRRVSKVAATTAGGETLCETNNDRKSQRVSHSPTLVVSSASSSRGSGGGDWQPRSNANSDDFSDEDVADASLTSRLTEMSLKKQFIYYQGKIRTIRVQDWPDANRIPLHERYRLADPMRKRYGKLSQRARLIKEFELAKKRPEKTTIPLLPRHLQQEARTRLMAWYRPLNLKVIVNGEVVQ